MPNVSISIDGLEPEHNRLRPGPFPEGSFVHVVRGIRTLLRRLPDLNLSVSTTLRTENFRAIDERFLDFVQGLGVNVLRLDPDFLDDIPLSVDEIVSHLIDLRRQIQARSMVLSALFEDPFHFLHGDDASFRCASSMGGSICVRPDGAIYPCQYIGQAIGHLDRFDTVYEEAPYRRMIVDAFKGLIPECEGCAIEGLCRGGCYSARLYDRESPAPEAREKKCAVLCETFNRIVLDELGKVGPGTVPAPARRVDPHGHAPEA